VYDRSVKAKRRPVVFGVWCLVFGKDVSIPRIELVIPSCNMRYGPDTRMYFEVNFFVSTHVICVPPISPLSREAPRRLRMPSLFQQQSYNLLSINLQQITVLTVDPSPNTCQHESHVRTSLSLTSLTSLRPSVSAR
jgi:hypothetical protein